MTVKSACTRCGTWSRCVQARRLLSSAFAACLTSVTPWDATFAGQTATSDAFASAARPRLPASALSPREPAPRPCRPDLTVRRTSRALPRAPLAPDRESPQKVHEAARPADIFGRAASITVRKSRVFHVRVTAANVFDIQQQHRQQLRRSVDPRLLSTSTKLSHARSRISYTSLPLVRSIFASSLTQYLKDSQAPYLPLYPPE